jgi:Mg-chelatase subunit ChlD
MNRTELSTIVSGSLADQARLNNTSLAESFLSAALIVIVDTSGSMGAQDSRGGQSRYNVACAELADLQRTMPGKVAVIAFSSSVEFVPGGVPPFLGGGTDLAGALQFAHVADTPGMRFVVISDGEPDSASDALAAAKKYANRIDTIYVGPESDLSGRKFLQQLAKASGGQSVTADRAKELRATIETLLLSA